MEKDVTLGSAGTASVAQAAGKLVVKANVAQPISVGGDVLGTANASLDVELDEVATLKHFLAKYSANPVVKEGLDLVIGAIAAMG